MQSSLPISSPRVPFVLFCVLALSLLLTLPAAAGGVTYSDLAASPAAGIDYERVPSTTYASFLALASQPLYAMPDIIATPEKFRGAPGVALLDFDGDGDLDVYATNGPGAANSLYANQLADGGGLTFVDVGAAAGVAATGQDSTGVCFGDLDNDGDPDLVVLGRVEANRLFENLGDGTFADVSAGSGLETTALGHTSCSLGDVDGDGLLDLFIANSFDWSSREAIFVNPYADNHPNLLYANQGGLTFADVSAASGILDLTGFQPAADGAPTITWATALVDYDQDGDVDVFHADDNAAIPFFKYGGVDRGYVHLLENDGTGQFTDVTVAAGLDAPGQWMGLTFADFNCDGRLDFFATNMGDYAFTALPIPSVLGDNASRWFLGNAGGGFDDPGVGALVATPFGWSAMSSDYDNDGDPDVQFFGSLRGAAYLTTGENPGAILENHGCAADFSYDAAAEASIDHGRRATQGGAAGDLDGDGFVDLVTAAASLYPGVPKIPYGVSFGSPFDPPVASYIEQFAPVGPMQFVWHGHTFPGGTLTVEVNSGGNGNASVAVDTVGTVGVTTGGRANRDGIGAVVSYANAAGIQTRRPVVGGSSYASQDALELVFGAGGHRGATGVVEVLWPGGVRNRLYGVKAGERVTFPEIPCGFDAPWASFRDYRSCVAGALDELEDAGLVDRRAASRLYSSAVKAYNDPR